MKFRFFWVAVTAVLFAASMSASADNHGSIKGVVLSAGGDPVAGAIVSLPELRQQTVTNDEGEFSFSGLAEGDCLVNVESQRFGGAVLRVAASHEAGEGVRIHLDKLVHSGRISVTAAGVARGLGEVANPVDVLVGDDLQLRKGSSLGETLAQQPGVTATSYGQGASRPVIRGLGQDRVRILENGLDTGDVSSIGPDHAVAMDPLVAEQIEVVRGPATVLWGANAIGGVVNVLDGRVPDRPVEQPVAGAVELEYGSNGDKKAGAAKLDGGGGNWAWHVDLYARDQGNYSSPAPRIGEEEHDDDHGDGHDHEIPELEGSGEVANSWTEAAGATVGASYVTDRGFIGLAVGGYRTDYGIPGHHHHHEEEHDHPFAGIIAEDHDHDDEEEEHAVHAELEQKRIDLHSQLDNPFSGFSAMRFSSGWRDYQHDEVEGDELGTQFENRWTEARFDLVNTPFLGFEGTLGLHYVNRDFAAAGEEAYVMPTDTDKLGLYLFEQTKAEPVGFQFGLRYDDQKTTTVDPALPDRDFSTWTASAGVVWSMSPAWSLAVSLNRPERAPTAEELYSDGPHAATFAYEIGDPDLDPEVGNNIDVSLRVEYESFEATLTGFVTRYDQFIFLEETGEEIDGFEVLQFSQADADFEGFELHGHVELLHTASTHLHLGFSYDQVEAEFRDDGGYLPRIPPRRARLALVYMSDAWDARIEGWWVDDQDRVAEHETPTPGYETMTASIGYKIFADTKVHELLLRGRNLLNAEAYNHTSFIKYYAPLPGRDISLVYRFLF